MVRVYEAGGIRVFARDGEQGPPASEPDGGSSPPTYFFCLDHGLVEGVVGCRGEVRLGPYSSWDEASRALETARRRTELWDEEDE